MFYSVRIVGNRDRLVKHGGEEYIVSGSKLKINFWNKIMILIKKFEYFDFWRSSHLNGKKQINIDLAQTGLSSLKDLNFVLRYVDKAICFSFPRKTDNI